MSRKLLEYNTKTVKREDTGEEESENDNNKKKNKERGRYRMKRGMERGDYHRKKEEGEKMREGKERCFVIADPCRCWCRLMLRSKC